MERAGSGLAGAARGLGAALGLGGADGSGQGDAARDPAAVHREVRAAFVSLRAASIGGEAAEASR